MRARSTRLAGSIRDRAINLNFSTSESPSDNSIASRHIAKSFVAKPSTAYRSSKRQMNPTHMTTHLHTNSPSLWERAKTAHMQPRSKGVISAAFYSSLQDPRHSKFAFPRPETRGCFATVRNGKNHTVCRERFGSQKLERH